MNMKYEISDTIQNSEKMKNCNNKIFFSKTLIKFEIMSIR